MTGPETTARQLVQAQTTEQLREALALTDELLDGGALSPSEYYVVCETRGWLIDELILRGDAERMGLVA